MCVWANLPVSSIASGAVRIQLDARETGELPASMMTFGAVVAGSRVELEGASSASEEPD